MIRTVLIIVISVLPWALLSQSIECEKFRNGSFNYPDHPDGLSVRRGNKQKSYSNGELQVIWKVDWIDDCTIQLTCKKIKNNKLPFKVGDRIFSEILSTDGNCMTTRVFLFQGEQRQTVGVEGVMCRQ